MEVSYFNWRLSWLISNDNLNWKDLEEYKQSI